MKILFTLIALGSVASVTADQYTQSYGTSESYYQDQTGSNYQQNQRQDGYNQRDYQKDDRNNQRDDSNYSRDDRNYQRDGRNYQRDDRNYQRDDRNYQRNTQYDYQQSSRDQSYNQQPVNQSYQRDQQRSYETTQNVDHQSSSSDQEINRKIHETLSSGWFSKGFHNVSYNVNNGNVNLRGYVDTQEDKNKVEDSVRKINGVRQINNQITISKQHSDSSSDSQLQNSERKYPQDVAANLQDRQINSRVREELSNGWFSKGYETLVIKTTNGVVVISGTVDKPEDIQKIGDQIKNIEGVRSINNRLTVKNR